MGDLIIASLGGGLLFLLIVLGALEVLGALAGTVRAAMKRITDE